MNHGPKARDFKNGLVLLSPIRRKRDIGQPSRTAAECEFDLVR